MTDPVRCNAERNDACLCAHGLVGPPPCQPPAPLLSGQAGRDDDITGLVIGREGDKGIWPAQGTVDTCLVGVRQRCQDDAIVGAADQFGDDSLPVVPCDERKRRPSRFCRQIHPNRQHRPRLRPVGYPEITLRLRRRTLTCSSLSWRSPRDDVDQPERGKAGHKRHLSFFAHRIAIQRNG